MDYPYSLISAESSRNVDPASVYVRVQSEFIQIDDVALTQAVQKWLLDNVPEVVSTIAERREQIYPVTQLPPLSK
jgi:hypothetical protein